MPHSTRSRCLRSYLLKLCTCHCARKNEHAIKRRVASIPTSREPCSPDNWQGRPTVCGPKVSNGFIALGVHQEQVATVLSLSRKLYRMLCGQTLLPIEASFQIWDVRYLSWILRKVLIILKAVAFEPIAHYIYILQQRSKCFSQSIAIYYTKSQRQDKTPGIIFPEASPYWWHFIIVATCAAEFVVLCIMER